MKALLDMIDTEDDLRRAIAVCAGKGMAIVHRGSNLELDEGILNERWLREDNVLEFGANFANDWRLSGRPDPRGKPFTGLRVHLVGTTWAMPCELQEQWITKAGGLVVDRHDQANVIVAPNRQLANLDMRAAVLIITEEVLRRALSEACLPPSLLRTKSLTDEAARLWTLLSSG